MKTFEETKKYIVDFATEKQACNSQLSRAKGSMNKEDLLCVIKDNLSWVTGNSLFNGVNILEYFSREELLSHSIGNIGTNNTGLANSGDWNSGNWNSGDRNSGDSNSGDSNSGNRNSGNWNSGNRNSGDSNSGNRNSGNRNSGDSNSGYRNSGDRNSGDWNSGYRNSGDRNSGNWNSGDRNSGDSNSGYRNSGNWNSGNWNSGNWNSGDRNSGNRNSGYRNSGNWNSGDRNSGDSNSGYRNSGAFCTNPNPVIYLFDKPTDILVKDWEQSKAYDLMCRLENTFWIESSMMTEIEKQDYPSHKTTGGYLKTITLKEAWGNLWGNLDDASKNVFLSLPNFDANKFEEITGIKTN